MTWEVAVSIIVIGVIFFYLYLSKLISDDHDMITMLWIFGAIILVWVATNTAIEIGIANTASADIQLMLQRFYIINVWIAIFTFGYFILYYINKALNAINIK